MSFEFFTLGGSQLWEDVFFYQKWRIQRNCHSKKYRLLDNWDIRRCSGTFEDCRQAFIKYIEIYEISRQRGHMVIMLHGMADSKNIFKPLWRKLLEANFMAAAINYPSTQKSLDSQVRQLDFLLNHLEDVKEVSFVTKGIGGIILRKLLAQDSDWQKKLIIRRVVQVSPPNQGSAFFTMLAKYKLCRKILGPIISQLSGNQAQLIPDFPNNIEFGIIAKDYPFKWLSLILPNALKSSLPSKNEVNLKSAKESIYIKSSAWNPFKSAKIVGACVNFLKNGKFEEK